MEDILTHNIEITNKVNEYFDTENYEAAKQFLLKKNEESLDDHWLLAQLAICIYELRDYKTALNYSQQAIELVPDCPLAQDYHAIILFANNRVEEAAQIWTALIEKGIDEIAYGQCGEGKRFAKSLLNDIYFRMGDVYLHKKQQEQALVYYKKHLENRQRGIYSNFTKKEVLSEIANIEKMI